MFRQYFSSVLAIALFITLATPVEAFADKVSGTLLISIADHNDGSYETFYDVLEDDGGVTRIDTAGLEKHIVDSFRSGVRVTVSGSTNAGTLAASSASVDKPAPLVAADGVIGGTAVTGSRSLAIIIADFSGGSSVTCSAATIESTVFTGTPSVRGNYEASSRNQVTWPSDTDGDSNADIFGPYAISEASGSCNAPLNGGWATAATTAATNAGVNLSLYQHVAVVVPSDACGYSGVAYVGCGNSCTSVILGCGRVITWTHELGHNLGLNHAASDPDNDGDLDPGSPVDPTTGLPFPQEYGDVTCPMGLDDSVSRMFNAPHQIELGWYDSYASKVTTPTTSGTYTIAPLENDPNASTNPQVIRVQKSGSDYYYLSYRISSGDYGQLSSSLRDKLEVHRYDSSSSNRTYLVALLDDGETFTDSSISLSVTQNSHDATGSTISLTVSEGDGGGGGGGGGGGTPDPAPEPEPEPEPIGCDADLTGMTTKYGLWNGFLGMSNILELINPDGSFNTSATSSIVVQLFSLDGLCYYEQALSLVDGQQLDVDVGQLAGFAADRYGIVKVSHTNSLAGRISYYKPAGSEYDFAYSVDLQEALTGETTLPYNTFRPGNNVTRVANWLTLVNLDSSTRTFDVYSTNGFTNVETLTYNDVGIAARARDDKDGGHDIFGENSVGTHRIVPASGSAPYLALLTRFGETSTSGSYAFAFPITAGPLSGSGGSVPISNQFGEQNWVEFNSAGSYTAYGPSGNILDSTNIGGHLNASALLANGERGVLVSNATSVLSMIYLSDSAGNITGVYGVPGRASSNGSTYNGSYNLFLGMDNWLTISNPTASSISASVYSLTNGTVGSKAIVLTPFETETIAVHSDSDLAAQTDNYGLLRVEPTSGAAPLLVDLLRFRNVAGELDFAFPTEVIRAD